MKNTQYTIAVWDIQFCKIDEDGNELLNDDGSVKLFTEAGNGDLSYIAEQVTEDELFEID